MSYTLDQYKEMAKRFNAMSFTDKILTIKNNTNILTLASDGNWWGVKVNDRLMQEQLEELEISFNIEREWDYDEMATLVRLLGIGNTDL